jgi:subtilisin family serine protease
MNIGAPRRRLPAVKTRTLIPATAVLAATLCLPGAAQADLFRDAALKADLAGGRAASAHAVVPLPLGPGRSAHASAARSAADRRALAGRSQPARVLLSVSSHQDVDAIAGLARELGSDVRVIRRLAVVSVLARSPAELVARIRGDRRVVAIEPDRTLRLAAEPDENVDPETGIAYGWAFDAVGAAPALAAVGGGSQRVIAVIDSGVDVSHPDIRDRIVASLNTNDGSGDVSDGVGHGTFVAGLIAMNGGNGLGGRGAGGNTRVFAIRADNGAGQFTTQNLLIANQAAIESGADILNLSLGGDVLTESEARALQLTFLNDVLPVAASGNGAEQGNAIQFPAAALGGRQGQLGIGLSVGAIRPDGTPAVFSTHNDFVSVAAPGGGQSGCAKGVFSTIPQGQSLLFDDPSGCSDVFNPPGHPSGRYAYSEGTSFATPLASAIAALAWQAEPRLQSQQVADVIQRSARQTIGQQPWNEFTGRGVIDGAAAIEAARRYDVTPPALEARARRSGSRVRLRVSGSGDRTDPGDELAGGVRYALAVRRTTGLQFIAGPTAGTISRTLRITRTTTFVGVACDANLNCRTRRLGRFRPRR